MDNKFAVAALLLLATPASAADISVTLNDQEQQAIRQMCEAAAWANKMTFADACTYFDRKLKAAALQQAKPEPKPEAEQK